eukprot:364444-Chlamydomonas_euryale.AAC.6
MVWMVVRWHVALYCYDSLSLLAVPPLPPHSHAGGWLRRAVCAPRILCVWLPICAHGDTFDHLTHVQGAAAAAVVANLAAGCCCLRWHAARYGCAAAKLPGSMGA